MGALGNVLATSVAGAADDYWYQRGGSPTPSGIDVTADAALGIPTVYACTAIIAETMGTLPLGMYQRVTVNRQASKAPAPNNPLDEVLGARPNDIQTAVEWREMMTAFALLRKFGLSEIVPGKRGAVDQLIPRHPDLITPKMQGGQQVYAYRDPQQNGRERILGPDQVFILRGRLGQSVIDFMRNSLSVSIAMQKYQGLLFARGARHAGVITVQGKLVGDARDNLRKSIDEYALGGLNSAKPMLLQDGMTWQDVGLTNKDSEFLSLQQFSVLEYCRAFRMPPHKVAELGRVTFANVEQMAIEFVTDTIRPWAVRWEQAISRDLILAPRVYFAEHNLEGLLRGDTATRFAAYAIAIQWGWFNPNEVRAYENLAPRVGGDSYLTPMNMNSTGAPSLPTGPNANVTAYLRLFARDAVARAVRKETASLAKLGESPSADAVGEFYREHGAFVAKLLHLSAEDGQRYAAERRSRLATGPLEDEYERMDALTDLALDRAEPLQLAA